MDKAIFLDKDGTVIRNVPYNVDPEKIVLYEDAPKALQLLQAQGYQLIMITNQPGIALGYFEEKAMEAVKNKIDHLLNTYGVQLNGFYYCPHDEKGVVTPYAVACDCRKPQSGLLLQAAKEWGINLSQSWMIGDILNDIEAGKKAGCKTVLIDNGGETEWILNEDRTPDYTAATLLEAAYFILNNKLPEANTSIFPTAANNGFTRL